VTPLFISQTSAAPLTKSAQILEAIKNPNLAIRERCNRSFYFFLQYFWPEISNDEFQSNWHILYLCAELQTMAERVGQRLPREYDLLINVPPGTTKTGMVSIMFPAWCWTKWYWMRFITASYSADLSLESAKYCRDMVSSERFQHIYPYIKIDPDKNTVSNFKILKYENGKVYRGGGRYSTSVGATMTGFHGHFLLPDDPLNPKQAASETELRTCITWVDQTLSTRRIDKQVAAMVLIQQRLHQGDPTGHLWEKKDKIRLKLISLPGEIRTYAKQVYPPELVERYVDGLLDPVRMPWSVLEEEEVRLGQYGYAAQYGQNPTPPGGGMFKVEHFAMVDTMPSEVSIAATVRYWDKAGTKDGTGAFTVGVKMHRLVSGKFFVSDVKRGRWASEERERIIRETAEADGQGVQIYHEQEPGSGGKDSAQATIRNLAGFASYADRPTGDKIFRADPYSVQVNNGNVQLLRGDWNREFIEEHRFFPFSKFKDQVDAGSGALGKLAGKKEVRILLR